MPAGRTAALELEHYRCPRCGNEALEERPMFDKDGTLTYEGGAYRTTWSTVGRSLGDELRNLGGTAVAG